jgi:hypothetical protein
MRYRKEIWKETMMSDSKEWARAMSFRIADALHGGTPPPRLIATGGRMSGIFQPSP